MPPPLSHTSSMTASTSWLMRLACTRQRRRAVGRTGVRGAPGRSAQHIERLQHHREAAAGQPLVSLRLL